MLCFVEKATLSWEQTWELEVHLKLPLIFSPARLGNCHELLRTEGSFPSVNRRLSATLYHTTPHRRVIDVFY